MTPRPPLTSNPEATAIELDEAAREHMRAARRHRRRARELRQQLDQLVREAAVRGIQIQITRQAQEGGPSGNTRDDAA